MKAMVCELCGSNKFVKQDGFFICQHCNTKYSPEDAKKLIVEVSGNVKIDNSQQIENYYQLARRAKEEGNSSEAAKYYDLIRQEYPNDWESTFFATYFAALQTNIAGIENAVVSVANSLPSVMNLIKNADTEVQYPAVAEVRSKCGDFASIMENSAVDHYKGIDVNIRSKYKGEFEKRRDSCRDMLYLLGDLIDGNFGADTDFRDQAVLAWKQGTMIHERILKDETILVRDLSRQSLYEYERKIGRYDSAYFNEKYPVWSGRIEKQIEKAKNHLNNLEKGKNSFNPSKLLVPIIFSVLTVVFVILLVLSSINKNLFLLHSSYFGLFAAITLIVAVISFGNVFPSKKMRARKEAEIAEQKLRIKKLEEEYTELQEEAQK